VYFVQNVLVDVITHQLPCRD